jgi:hypothetical protein
MTTKQRMRMTRRACQKHGCKKGLLRRTDPGEGFYGFHGYITNITKSIRWICPNCCGTHR